MIILKHRIYRIIRTYFKVIDDVSSDYVKFDGFLLRCIYMWKNRYSGSRKIPLEKREICKIYISMEIKKISSKCIEIPAP